MNLNDRLNANMRISEKCLDIIANNKPAVDITPLIKQLAFQGEVLLRLLTELEKRDIKIDIQDIFDKFIKE